MITCTVRMTFDRRLRDEAVQILRALVGPVRSERGCAQTQLMHDVHDDAVVTWVSRWNTRRDLDQHLKSNHFRRLLAVMELASESPAVEIAIDGDIRGFDLIEEMLGHPGPPANPNTLNRYSNGNSEGHQGETP